MKLAATTVGYEGYGKEECNKKRLSVAKRALQAAIKRGAQVLVLPGGFLTAHSYDTRKAIADSLKTEAEQLGIGIVFGVDQQLKNPNTDEKILSKGQLLPYYGYAWSPSEDVLHCWQQRSSTRANQWARVLRDAICGEERILRIGNETLAVLMCGEIFNERIRNAVADYHPKPKVVVDVAHEGSGFRVFQAMKVLARLDLPSICSVHAQREFAVKHCYVPPGTRLSSGSRDGWVYGPPTVELKLWTF